MSNRFSDIVPQSIWDITPYKPGKPTSELQRDQGLSDIIKLASNENPLGPSPKALSAAKEALQTIALYPNNTGVKLKAALAEKLALSSEQIILDNGSNNLFPLIAQAFVWPGDAILVSDYAFFTYSLVAKQRQAELISVPTKNWGHNLSAMADAITPNTRLIFLANPNNPTGTYFDDVSLKAFLKKVPTNTLVVLDEAYSEYINAPDYPNGIELLTSHPNLIITRTFSKIYGLAGLRVGYAIADPEIIGLLTRMRTPFNVNSVALAAAEAALKDDEHTTQSKNMNKQGMQQLCEGFSALDLDYIPSVGNFITITLKQNATSLYENLLTRGIIIRPLNPYNMPKHLRITVGLPEQNVRLLTALKDLL